ncbi:hypothetical protein BH11BAC1_BH11BAC1_27040 [soil metagenome]
MKNFLLTLLIVSSFYFSKAQVICILCFDQNDSISDNISTNFIQNGGFENTTVAGTAYFCPNSSFYSGDFLNWTCTGGGTSTYAHNSPNNSLSLVVEGLQCAYLGNFYCNPCSNITNDTSCVSDSACTVNNLPPGFPSNTAAYGNSTGVSIEQTVTGLTIGATYVLEFWAGGEGTAWPKRGLFGVDVGFGDTLLRCKETSPFSADIGTRYLIEFSAVSTSHTIKFTNWGHICSDCTELMVDDVRLYPLADLDPSVSPCLGINPIALFSAPNHICPGTCTQFNNLSLNCFTYLWSFPGANPSTSTDVSPANICYNTPGAYPVTLIGTNSTTSDTITLNNYVTVYPYPAPQGIAQSGDTLISNQGAVTYQWYYNGNLINGATMYYYVAPASGDYSVVATDNNGCEVEAIIFNVVAGLHSVISEGDGIYIYPNPVSEKFTIHNAQFTMGAAIEMTIYNYIGELVFVSHQMNIGSKQEITLDVAELPAGIYHLRIGGNDKTFHAKFVKTRGGE